jgi:streptogramin lyase
VARLYSSPSTRAKDLAILAMRLASDRSEGSSPRAIQEIYLSRQSALMGAGSTSITSASSAPYPSRRESTYASFEGSSSIGSAPAEFEGAPEGSVWFEGCGSRVTEGWATSRAKTFEGTVIRPDAIFASSSASSLYRRGT